MRGQSVQALQKLGPPPARGVSAVPSRTTLIGWGPGAGLVNGALSLVGVQDIFSAMVNVPTPPSRCC